MDAIEARMKLEGAVAALNGIRTFARTDAGSPANAPWLTGTLLQLVDDATGSADDALVELADAEVLGDDAAAIEPGTPYVPPARGAML